MIEMLREAWGKLLGPAAEALWTSLSFWRLLALVLVTAIAVLVAYRQRILDYFINRQERRTHDREVFQPLAALLSEERLRAEIDIRFFNDRTSIGFQTDLEEFLEKSGLAGNRFLDRRCQRAMNELRSSIDKLLAFINREFDAVSPSAADGTIIRLRPDLNLDFAREPSDEKSAEYFQKSRDLRALVARVDEAHQRYRQSIKQHLLL